MIERKLTGGDDPAAAWLRFVAMMIVTGVLPASELSERVDVEVRKLIRLKCRDLKPLPDDVVFIGSPRSHPNYRKTAHRSYPTWMDKPYGDWNAEQKSALHDVIYPRDDLTSAERKGVQEYALSRAVELASKNQRDWTACDKRDLLVIAHAFAEFGGLAPLSPFLAALARNVGLAPKGGIRDLEVYERYLDIEASAPEDPRGLAPSALRTADILRRLGTHHLQRGEDFRKKIEGWRRLPASFAAVHRRRIARLLDRNFPSDDDKSEFYAAPPTIRYWALAKMRASDPLHADKED